MATNLQSKAQTQFRRTAEKQLRTTPASVEGAESDAERRLVHELQVHQIELEMQNEELRAAQRQLEESRDHYAAFYDLAPVGYVTFDREGKIREVNLTAADMVGVPRARLIGQAFQSFVAVEDLAQFLPHLKERAMPEERVWSEFALARKGRANMPVVMQSVPVTSGEKRLHCYRGTLTDLSALQQAQSSLRDSDTMLHLAAQAGNIGFWDWDLKTDDVRFSAEWKSQLGYAPNEISDRFEEWRDRLHPEDAEAALAKVRGFIARPQGRYDIEFRLRHKDGSYRWINALGDILRGKKGAAVRMLGCHIDISARKQAEEALAASERKFAGVVGSAMDAIVGIDAGQRIVLFNAAAEKMFGCRGSGVLGSAFSRFIPKRFRDVVTARIRRFDEDGETTDAAGVISGVNGLRSDGQEFPVEASVSKLETGSVRIFTIILRDITDRRRLECELLETVDREQRRIGLELHDDLGQRLTGMSLICHSLRQSLVAHPELQKDAALLDELLRNAVSQTRALSQGLAPLLLELGDVGLAHALDRLARTTNGLGKVKCRFRCSPGLQVADQTVSSHLYRIAQEAVNNVLKHARARKVDVTLSLGRGTLRLRVSDDGRGFFESNPPHDGMGLRVMSYRAHLIGGTLVVNSEPGKGVTVNCAVPLRKL